MSGDVRLGLVLRELRVARGLTLAAVARRAGCALSLVSYVESGQRALLPWLAEELDRIFGTGSVVASLARGSGGTRVENLASGVPERDVFAVLLPGGGVMPLSRREVLTALGLGMATGGLQDAETLSWLSVEVGDLQGAMWWMDRASQWAQAAGWPGMAAWSFVRRSVIVMSFSGDGIRVVDQARPVLEMPQVSPRMKGLAAKQIAYGYALAGIRDKSHRALDTAMDLLAQPIREDDAVLARSVADGDLFAVYQATCDVYLGYGARVIPVLEPRMQSLAKSLRTATITRAKLARAYANAGLPEEACRVAWDTLDAIDQIDSQSARNELRRAVPVLNRWHGRSDVQDIVHRLGT